MRQFIDGMRQRRRLARLFHWRDAGEIIRFGRLPCGRELEVTLLCQRLTGETGGDRRLFLRAGTTDLDVLNSVFFRRDYQLPSSRQTGLLLEEYKKILHTGGRPVILDCGGNVGFSAVWFKLHFPGAIVVAVEPDPGNFALLEKNLAGFTGCLGVPAAVHHKRGWGRLRDAGNGEWGFQIIPEGTGETGGIPLFSPVELLAQAGVHFAGQLLVPWICKVDIEGGELGLFQEADDWFHRFSLYAIELHDAHFPGQKTSTPFLSQVVKNGYEIIFNHEVLFAFRP